MFVQEPVVDVGCWSTTLKKSSLTWQISEIWIYLVTNRGITIEAKYFYILKKRSAVWTGTIPVEHLVTVYEQLPVVEYAVGYEGLSMYEAFCKINTCYWNTKMWFIEVLSFDDRIGKMIELLYLCNGSSTSRYPKMEKIVYTWFYQSKYDYYDDNIILWLLIVFIFYHSLLDYATNTEGACTISIRGTRARALGRSHANSLQASCWNSRTCTII